MDTPVTGIEDVKPRTPPAYGIEPGDYGLRGVEQVAGAATRPNGRRSGKTILDEAPGPAGHPAQPGPNSTENTCHEKNGSQAKLCTL